MDILARRISLQFICVNSLYYLRPLLRFILVVKIDFAAICVI